MPMKVVALNAYESGGSIKVMALNAYVGGGGSERLYK